MSKSQSEFPSPKKLCRAPHSGHGEEERCSNCHLDGNHPATGPGLPSPAAVEQVPSLDQGQGTHHHEDCPSPHPDTSVDTAYTAGAPRPPPHPTLPPGPPQRPTYRLVATARRRSENHAKTAAGYRAGYSGYTGLATLGGDVIRSQTQSCC